MSLPTFLGGVHPPDHKALTADKPIERLTPAGEYVFPMSQHIGAPCSPTVKKGERVLVGQTVGDSEEFVSAPVISSVSGTVKDIALRMAPTGAMDTCVVVESDGLFERADILVPRADLNSLSPKEIIQIVRKAGIVGMGGAAFPTHVKLSPPPDSSIQWIIVNGAECEPFLNCDNRLMIEDAADIVVGLEICLKLFPAAKGVIAIENNKPEAIRAIQAEVSKRSSPRMTVMPHAVKYPQGAEKMLILSVTGQEIPPGALPAAVGCVIINVRTLWHIKKAVVEGEPVTTRVVTVAGDAVLEPKNLLVPLGAPIRSLIEACGGFKEEPLKVLSGGPMMGTAMRSLDVPVVKGMSGITALTAAMGSVLKETSCIRCGKCVSACPERLMPNFMSKAVRARDFAEFDALGGMNCVECGSCSYVCPARRFLVQDFKTGKAVLNDIRRKQHEAEQKKQAQVKGEKK